MLEDEAERTGAPLFPVVPEQVIRAGARRSTRIDVADLTRTVLNTAIGRKSSH